MVKSAVKKAKKKDGKGGPFDGLQNLSKTVPAAAQGAMDRVKGLGEKISSTVNAGLTPVNKAVEMAKGLGDSITNRVNTTVANMPKPATPATPAVPKISPAVPAMPSMPKMPKMPDMPKMPEFPGATGGTKPLTKPMIRPDFEAKKAEFATKRQGFMDKMMERRKSRGPRPVRPERPVRPVRPERPVRPPRPMMPPTAAL